MCGNNGTKGKISKIVRALGWIRDLNGFTGVSANPTPCRLVTRKQLERIEVTAATDSRSDHPVSMDKYKEMVVMRSLKET